MKALRIIVAAVFVCCLFSNCAAIKNRRCDCPKFSQTGTSTEQVTTVGC